ncbi:MAG: DUF3352 domain-containing protein [Solirubrobacterales bacterium]
MKARFHSALALAALAAALLAAGCGGGGNDEGVAAIAPADASLYFDADLKPEGDQKENLDGFLSVVLDTDDPGQKITELIDQGFEDQGEQRTFADDVKPWLGDTGGVFTVGYQDNPPAVAAVQSDDTGAGVELLRSESKSVTDREYKGVKYQINDEGDAFGAIEDFVALGDEPAYRAAIDASEGDSLADAEKFKDAISDISDDALARGYLNLKALIGQVAQEQGVPSGTAAGVASKIGIDDSLVLSAESDPKSVAIDLHGLGNFGGPASDLLGDLPADTSFAIGLSDVGGRLKGLVDAVESAGIPGVTEGTIAAAVQTQADLDLNEDVLSWLGDAALFVRGTDPATADGALVIKSKDDASAALALDKLGTLLENTGQGNPEPLELGSGGNGFQITDPNFAQPLNVVQQNGLFVIGLGPAATQAVLTPTETLADAEPFTAATGTLGDAGPAFFAAIPQLVSLLGATSGVNAEEFAKAKPYLDRLAFLTGGQADGSLRIVLGAK